MRIPGTLLATALLGAAIPFTSIAATRPHSHAHAAVRHVIRVAPADEYFGRLKMSILGIRNQLRDLSLRMQYAPSASGAVLGSAAFVEDAIRDWEHKYPGDPWLAKSVYQLTELYARANSALGRQRESRTLTWLLSRYGKTWYGRWARSELADTAR